MVNSFKCFNLLWCVSNIFPIIHYPPFIILARHCHHYYHINSKSLKKIPFK
ncbi:hypothetical protein HanIR_Chr02g0052821 [Helianthus annuus]|nr:hypothetical protein HanIR_Chr02g0052821 [Helianthus annuus]